MRWINEHDWDDEPKTPEEIEKEWDLYEDACEDRFESQRENYYETWN